jgi:hypothetical protein
MLRNQAPANQRGAFAAQPSLDPSKVKVLPVKTKPIPAD